MGTSWTSAVDDHSRDWPEECLMLSRCLRYSWQRHLLRVLAISKLCALQSASAAEMHRGQRWWALAWGLTSALGQLGVPASWISQLKDGRRVLAMVQALVQCRKPLLPAKM